MANLEFTKVVDITPDTGLLPGVHFEIGFTLTDRDNQPITGSASNIYVDIKKPITDDETVKTDTDLVEVGGGEYYYKYLIPDETGKYFVTVLFDGANKGKLTASFKVGTDPAA